MTPRTAAVLINTPHNPTGRVYPTQQLEELARVLTEASDRHGRTVYLRDVSARVDKILAGE